MFKTLTLLFGAAVTMVAAAADMEWMTDLKAAGKKAAAEDKLLLVEFTGSDWCAYCIQQKKAVLDKPEFAEWANKHCVAVEIDIPQDAARVGGEEKKAYNKKLSEEYGISNFPSLMLMTPELVLVGGYSGAQSSPQAAIAILEQHFNTAKELKKALKKKKTERAVALKAIYDKQPENIRKGNFQLMELIAKADNSNKTGIRDEYRPLKQTRTLQSKLEKAATTEERIAILDAAYKKALPQNKASIKNLKVAELTTAAVKLMQNPASVEDICKARDFYLQAAECNGNASQKADIEKYYADPEKLYRDIREKQKK